MAETYHEVLTRQKKEESELEQSIKSLIKNAKKADKPVVESQCIQMQYDLRAKHNEELERFEDEDEIIENVHEEKKVSETENQKSIEAKKSKALRKKEKKQNKNIEKELIKLSIKESSGPSAREIELNYINSILEKDSLKVKEIISDGNCLYRAISDQLAFTNQSKSINSDSKYDYLHIRKIAGKYLRENPGEFAPFLGLDESSVEYANYCEKVESPTSSEWGGQVELRAIANALERQVHIYDSTAPVITMGEVYSPDQPLKITYHRHYFSLGEHYNSVEPIDCNCTQHE